MQTEPVAIGASPERCPYSTGSSTVSNVLGDQLLLAVTDRSLGTLTKGLMVVCRNVYRQRDMVHSQNRSRLVTWICKALTLLSGDVLGVSEKHFIVH